MKLRLAVLAGILTSTSAYAANPASQPLGSSTTLGNASSNWALSSANNNPASPYMLVGPGDKTRFGIVTALSGGYELGAVDDIMDKIDELDEKLDRVEDNLTEALTLQDDFNELLEELGENASLKLMGGATVPLLPFIYKTEKLGAFTFSSDITTSGSGQLLTDQATLFFNPLTTEFQLSTATSIYVKNYLDLKFSLGWSKPVWELQDKGTLYAGARVNMHNITLGKSVLAMSALTSDEADDAITGEFEDNQKDTSAASFDLGLIWSAQNYQVGLSMINLNEPSFDYAGLGTNCLDSDEEADQINCFAAAEFASQGLISKDETHVMGQQATVEGSFFNDTKSFTVSAAYDTNAVNDALGDQYQWMSVSAQLNPGWLLVSNLRGGYRKNLVGDEFSYASFGATFFKGLNFDMSYGLESVGDVPRSIYLSLGIETSF